MTYRVQGWFEQTFVIDFDDELEADWLRTKIADDLQARRALMVDPSEWVGPVLGDPTRSQHTLVVRLGCPAAEALPWLVKLHDLLQGGRPFTQHDVE